MKRALSIEWQMWRSYGGLYLLIFLFPLLFGMTFFGPVSLFFFIMILSQAWYSEQANMEKLELSLPVSRDDRLLARFLIYPMLLIVLGVASIVFVFILTQFAAWKEFVGPDQVASLTSGIPYIAFAWFGGMLLVVGLLLLIYTVFSFKWATIFIGVGYFLSIGLLLLAANVDMESNRTNGEVSGSIEVTGGWLSQLPVETAMLGIGTLGLIVYVTCFFLARLSYRRKTI